MTIAEQAVAKFKTSRAKQNAKKGQVRCYDCQAIGYMYPIGKMLNGWVVTSVRSIPLFLCPECQKKRREFLQKQLSSPTPGGLPQKEETP